MNIINSTKNYMDRKADKSEMIGIVAQTDTLNDPLADLNSSFFFKSVLIPTVHASWSLEPGIDLLAKNLGK